MIQPCCKQNAQDADEVWRKPDAEMDLHNGQVQINIFKIENFIGFCKIRHNARQADLIQQLAQNPTKKGARCQE